MRKLTALVLGLVLSASVGVGAVQKVPTSGLDVSAPVKTMLDSSSNDAVRTNIAVNPLASIAALKAYSTAGLVDGQVIDVTSYYASAIPDGGGGRFKWDSTSSATANGGTIIAPDAGGVGRWRRVTGKFNIDEFGAKGDYPTTDDTTAINAAITAAGKNVVTGKRKQYKVTASLDATQGADIDDTVQLRISNTLFNTYAHRQLVWGQEHLWGWFNKIRTKTAVKIVFSGDSTTFGTGITDSAYNIDNLILNAAAQDGFTGVTVVNRGQAGKDTSEWVSTYLAGDIAQAPDLLVLRWGINDPYNGRTLAQFATSLRAGLATYRASRAFSGGNGDILLMTPNVTSDTPNGRDEFWYEEVVKVVRRAARDYNCAFIDTYGLFQNGRDAAGLYMDDPFADGRAIHPKDVFNLMIGSKIYDLIFPSLARIYFRKPTEAAPSLQNSWINFGGGTKDAAYYKDRNQVVHIAGMIKSGTTTNDTLLFTLPANYRPPSTVYFSTVSNGAVAGVYIESDGEVRIFFGASATYFNLSGISFLATQ